MLSHEFVYPRVTPHPAPRADDPGTPPEPPPDRQRELVIASLIQRPGTTTGSARSGLRA